MNSPESKSAWKALQSHHADVAGLQMSDLFAQDSQRFNTFSCTAAGLFLDYSKNRITSETLSLLLDLARQSELSQAINNMFDGDIVNNTEHRPVLHTALRHRGDRQILVDGRDVMPSVRAVFAQMRSFSDSVREGNWRGCGGQPITDIVNIGIGGSDLGPLMVTEALDRYSHERPEPAFRVECRWHTYHAYSGIAGRLDHTVYYCLKNVYDPGNACQCAHSAGLVCGANR